MNVENAHGGAPVFRIVADAPRGDLLTFCGCAMESTLHMLTRGMQGGLSAEDCWTAAQLLHQAKSAYEAAGATD